MVRVELSGNRQVALKIFHKQEQDNCGVTNRVTQVDIVNEAGDTLTTGQAKCHENDNFSKVVGRKVALARAARPFKKDERKAIWDAFRAQCKYK